MSQNGSATDAAMQFAIRQARSGIKTDKEPTPAQAVDFSFLREVQQELKIR